MEVINNRKNFSFYSLVEKNIYFLYYLVCFNEQKSEVFFFFFPHYLVLELATIGWIILFLKG